MHHCYFIYLFGCVTLYILFSCLGCEAVYASVWWPRECGLWTSLPSTHNVDADRIANFLSCMECGQSKRVLHIYADYISLNDGILLWHRQNHRPIRIMFIVTVSVIHCWLCLSTNRNSERCHTAPPWSVHSVNGSIKGCLMTCSLHSVTQSFIYVTLAELLYLHLVNLIVWWRWWMLHARPPS